MLGDNDDLARHDSPDRAPTGPNRGAVVVQDRGRGYGAYEWYPDDQQDDGRIDVQKYLRVLRKHWLIITACLILALAGGVASILLTTPIYTAAVSLKIDREAARVGDLTTNEPVDASTTDEFFQTQHELLKSRALAEHTIDTMNLTSDQALLKGLGIGKPGRDGKRPSATDIRNQLIGAFQANLNVVPIQRSRLVKVTFDSPDPQASARVANDIADSFIEWNLELRLNANKYSRDFLSAKIAEEKDKLETAEHDLEDYASKNKIINITSTTDDKGSTTGASTTLVGSSLVAANSAYSAARDARIKAKQVYDQAVSGTASAPAVMQDPTITSYKQALAQAQVEYQQKGETQKPTFGDMPLIKARIDELNRAIDAETTAVIASLKAQYQAALGEEQQQQDNVAALQHSFLSQNTQSIEYGLKQMAADTSKAQYESLLDNFKTVSVAGGIDRSNISKIDAALAPGAPSKPQRNKIMLVAALAGLFVGIGLAFVIEYMDESIRAPEDVEKKLGLPLLGTIPKLERSMTPAEAMQDVRSAFSESYYSVRTALQFSTDEGVPASLLVTSARPSEGKSTSAVAIAQNFARLGLRVLLIDGDLRNPSLHRALQAENNAGLSNYLTGGLPLSRLVQPTQIACLSFIPCGPLPPNPAELLAGSRIEMLLREARAAFDIVVIDGPPIMGLADGPLLAATVAGTMIVIEAGATGRNLARVALRRLNVGAPRILGVLLTKFDAKKSSYGYGYGYGYAYDYAYGSKPQIKGGN